LNKDILKQFCNLYLQSTAATPPQ